MITANFPLKQNQRRQSALTRLELQLKSGVKPSSEGNVKLEQSDITRINREIKTLNESLNPDARSKRSKRRKR